MVLKLIIKGENMEKKAKKKEKFYVEIPFIYKDKMKEMFDIRWDLKEKKWFTKDESDIQYIEKKIEMLKSLGRNSVEEEINFLKEQIKKLLKTSLIEGNEDGVKWIENQLENKSYDLDLIFQNATLELMITPYKKEHEEFRKLQEKYNIRSSEGYTRIDGNEKNILN